MRYYKNWFLLRQKITNLPTRRYCGKVVTSERQEQHVEELLDALRSGSKPVFLGRLGVTENYLIIDHEFIESGLQKDYSSNVYRDAQVCAGMYPLTKASLSICATYQREALKNMTHFSFWHLKMEPYWIKRYCRKDVVLLSGLNPHRLMGALEGKRVLVVSSFPKTIAMQYEKRRLLFENERFLPDFHLILEKAPVTNAGAEPSFPTWEDSLLDCYRRCMNHMFDVALIGAGSYSTPLGNLIFQTGHQVAVLNSNIQIVFGIKGRRWETQAWAEGTRALFNEHWVYPLEEETPPQVDKVDGGSYWK